MENYINTAATDFSRARTVGLKQLTPLPFPVLAYGDGIPVEFFFASNGVIEDWSGDSSNGLRATLGEVGSGPFGGTFTLTCGETTGALPYNMTADGIANVLNALATVIAAGYVDVDGEFPNYMISWRTVGSKTAITASAVSLLPISGIAVTTLQAGTGSLTQRIALTLRRNAIDSTEAFTPVSSPQDGWSGSLSTNTEAALSLLLFEGVRINDFVQAVTVLTVERIQPDSTTTTVFQAPIVIRAKNVDLGATGSPDFATYVTNTTFLANAVQNRSSITGLASASANAVKLGGLATASAAIAAGAVYALNFSVTVNDGGGTHAGILTMIWQLQSSTHATSHPLWIRPFDYNASTNAVVWRLLGCFLDTLPASYNGDTGKFHYIGAAGAANAVTTYCDQTGTSAPA